MQKISFIAAYLAGFRTRENSGVSSRKLNASPDWQLGWSDANTLLLNDPPYPEEVLRRSALVDNPSFR